MPPAFALDPKLAADTAEIGDLALCTVRLLNDARFPWLVLVPARAGIAELFELSASDRAALIEEVSQCAAALRAVTQCLKINVGALGNVVRQLHVHVVARFENDAAWPGPVWGAGTAIPYEKSTQDDLIARIRSALAMRT